MQYVPQYLVGQTAFVQGVGLLGTVKSVALPKIEQMRETITQGGFEQAVATGLFKAMKAELDLSECHDSAYIAMQTSGALIVIKGSIKQAGKSIPVVATFKGSVDVDDGTMETGKEMGRKISIFCDYYALEIAGVLQVQMDVTNNIAMIMGVDHLETMRKHIL